MNQTSTGEHSEQLSEILKRLVELDAEIRKLRRDYAINLLTTQLRDELINKLLFVLDTPSPILERKEQFEQLQSFISVVRKGLAGRVLTCYSGLLNAPVIDDDASVRLDFCLASIETDVAAFMIT